MKLSFLKFLIISFLFFYFQNNLQVKAQTLDPPTNVTATQEGTSIRLNWVDPVEDGFNRPTLSWNTSDVDTIGNTLAYTDLNPLFVGTRFDYGDFNLNNHVGRKVKAVDIYAENPTGLCTFKLQIFRCTTWSNYQIQKVYEQPFTLSETGQHTVVDLSSDFYITPNFIFYTFGYQIYNPNTSAIPVFGMDEGPNIYRRGDVLNAPNYNNAWNYVSEGGSWFGINISANFIVKVILSEKYNIYRNGELIATTYEPTYLDTDALPNQEYCYTIKTVYVNSLSESSNTACCTRTPIFNAPNNLNISINNCIPTLSWAAADTEHNDGTFLYYRIYRGDTIIGTTINNQFQDIEALHENGIMYSVCAAYQTSSEITESIKRSASIDLPLPEASIIAEETSLCYGDSVLLIAETDESNIIWSTGETYDSIFISPSTSSMFYLTATNSNGCQIIDSVFINVLPLPNAMVSPDYSICLGDSAILTATGGNHYIWNNGDTTNEIVVAPETTTIYHVQISNEYGCSVNKSISVYVHYQPNIVISNDTSICLYDSALLSIQGEGIYLWNTGDTDNHIMVAPLETTTYSVIVTNEFGCFSEDSVSVVVYPLPDVSISGINAICVNEQTVLTADGDASSYLWNTGDSNDSITVTPIETTTYSVIGTNEFGCFNSDSFTVEVHDSLKIQIIGDTSLCIGESTTLSVIGGVYFVWDHGETSRTITVTPTETTTYHVTSQNEFGCVGEQFITVNVHWFPDISISGDTSICTEETTTLYASGSDSYLWSNGSQDDSITVTLNTTTSYSVTSVNTYGCSATKEVTIYVFEFPNLTISGTDTICFGEEAHLVASGASTYLWNTGETEDELFSTPLATTEYNVIGTSEFGCSVTEHFTVNVKPFPSVALPIVGEQTVCKDSTYLYSTSLLNTSNYIWNVSDGIEIISGQGTPDISVIISESVNSGQISVYGTNDCGNSDTLTSLITALQCNIPINGNFSVCANSIETYSVIENQTDYQWDIVGGEIINGEGTHEIQVHWQNSGIGSIQINYLGAAPTLHQILINDLPHINIMGDSIICRGETASLVATGGVQYEWNTGEDSSQIEVVPTQTSTYFVIGTDSIGCSSEKSMTITVNDLPYVLISGDSSICVGETAILTASGGISYLWNNHSETNSISVSPENTTTYSVTAIDMNSCSNSDSIIITVNSLPISNIEGSTSLCFGDSSILTATGGSEYLWNTGEETAEIIISPDETSTYSVIVTNENGCSTTDSALITIHDLPTVEIEGNTTLCLGSSTTLTASGGTSYLWSTGEESNQIYVSPSETTIYSVVVANENNCIAIDSVTVIVNNFLTTNIEGDTSICIGESSSLTATGGTLYLWNTSEETASISVSPTNTTTYSVDVTDDFGCTATDSVTVSVNDLPVVQIEGNTSICFGESASLTATGGTSYLWNTGEESATISVSPSATTTYYVVATSDFGCTTADSITVTVNDLPIVQIAGITSICFGESTALTATGGTSYLWNTGEESSTISVSPSTTTTYSVITTNDFGCTTADSVTIIVNDLPVIQFEGNTSICFGESTALTATGGISYLWNTGEENASISISPFTTTIYSVVATNDFGCTATDSITITVNDLPIVQIEGITTICFGESTALTATGGTSYLWNTGEEIASISVSPSTTTIYSVVSTNDFGCTAADSVTVTVNDLPIVQIEGNTTICFGESTSLTATGGISYLWNTGEENATISVSPSTTTTYSVFATNDFGCTTTDSVTIIVNDLPIVQIEGNTSICFGESTALTATGGISYLWNSGEENASISVSPSTTTIYSVVATNDFGCTATDSVTITVNDLPIVQIEGNTSICFGESTALTATGGISYLWNTGEENASISISPSITTTYSVIVTNDFGCTATDSVTITVNDLPVVQIEGNTTICFGESTSLTATGGTSYLWNTVEENATISVTPLATTTYSVIVTNDFGCTAIDSITITVNDLPIVQIEGNTSICFGESTSLTVTGGSSYLWNTGDTSSQIIVSPSATTTYSVSVTNSDNCTSVDSIIVEVEDLPETPILTAFGYLDYIELSWDDLGDFEYNVFRNNMFLNTTFESFYQDFDVDSAELYCYYVEAQSTNCTSDTSNNECASITLSVNEIGMNNYTIYPNPANNYIQILGENIQKIVIYDMLGKLILEQKSANSQNIINTTHLESGIYLLKIGSSKGYHQTKRMVIIH